MMLMYIAFFVFIFIIILLSLLQDLIRGDIGKSGQIRETYSFLKNQKLKKPSNEFGHSMVKKISSTRQQLIYTLATMICILLLSIIVFKSLFLSIVLSSFGLIIPKAMIGNMKNKKRLKLQLQLRDALNSIMASLKAGLSLNSSLVKCAEDLERMYSFTKDNPMLEEFLRIRNDLGLGFSVDEALKNFRDRINMEDVDDFVNSILIVRKKGGNLVEVMSNVSEMITDKIDIQNEINILTTGKKMEAKILTLIPIFIIIALSVLSPTYMKPLLTSTTGNVLIVLGFALLIINYFIGKKITDINI